MVTFTRYACAYLLLAALFGGTVLVSAKTCTEQDVLATDSLVDQHKVQFSKCLKALQRDTNDLLAFIDAKYIDQEGAKAICGVEACVGSLVTVMEELPDCCSTVSGARNVINRPRLADDILHQCDLHDAKLLAAELEREIAKLPDLKVQIKTDTTATGSAHDGSMSTSGSTVEKDGSQKNSGDDEEGVDIIIDVKKRELMKSGQSITSREKKREDGTPSSSTLPSFVSHQFFAVLTLATVVQLLVEAL